MENMESGYVEALELERMKMLVFGRELPLSIQLVSRVIEKYKQQRLSVPLSEETTSNDRGPVLEFIPMKNSPINTFAFSPEISGDHHQQDLNQQPCPSEKSDWLRSVQLWNQTPNLTNEPSRRESDADRKGSYNTGMEKSAESGSTDHAKNQNQLGKRVGVSKTDICEESMKRKQRRCWSQELHKRFLHSLRQLGGPHVATPKQIRELMKVDGLTNDEVKSHLQKYRLHTRRPAMSHDQDNNGHNTQATQFMVVGGIWVPPSSDYPTMSLANREEVNTDSGSPPMDGVYTPMAAPHSWVQFNQEPQIKMNKNSDGHGDALARCISPSMSSSTRTTASPIY